jgi:hypothetical protein
LFLGTHAARADVAFTRRTTEAFNFVESKNERVAKLVGVKHLDIQKERNLLVEAMSLINLAQQTSVSTQRGEHQASRFQFVVKIEKEFSLWSALVAAG